MAHGQQTVPPGSRQEKASSPRAAESSPGSVHRMVIEEGPNRRVQYIATGNLSTSDRLAVYDLERAENELAYVRNLQHLKEQYVNSERVLEPHRRIVQQQLYGTQQSYSSYSSSYVSYMPYEGYGYPGGLYGYYGAFSPFFYGPFSYGYAGYPGGFGYSGGVIGSYGSSTPSETRSLQYGVGDEGYMKDSLAQLIAQQSTPEYAATVERDYEEAIARAAESPILSRDLHLRKSAAPAPQKELSFTKGSKETIWIGNEKYEGTVKDDRPGWVVLQTDKADVTIRKSEITRTETPPKPSGFPTKNPERRR
jgi:hypothetical protein